MIPATALDGTGRPWAVRRAWPDKEGGVVVEAVRGGERHVRGGRVLDDGTVRLGPLGADRRLPALAEVAERGTVVVHRLGRRAVVRERSGDFLKIVRPGRAPALAVAAAPDGWPAALALAPVLGADEGTVRFGALPGRSLRALGEDPGPGWAEAWAALADAWPSVPAAAVRAGAEHGPDREAAVLRTWARMAAPLAERPAALLGAAEHLAARLESEPSEPLRPAHRDLHDGQVLWDPTAGLAVLDLDTLAFAEPSLDLGNLLAHLRWRVLQGGLDPIREARIRGLLGRATRHVDPVRLRLHEEAAALRIACVNLFRPPSAALAAARLRALA